MSIWHIAYSYVNADGDAFDREEFVPGNTANDALECFDKIADDYRNVFGWKNVLVWGVKLMHKLGVDAVKEAE